MRIADLGCGRELTAELHQKLAGGFR